MALKAKRDENLKKGPLRLQPGTSSRPRDEQATHAYHIVELDYFEYADTDKDGDSDLDISCHEFT